MRRTQVLATTLAIALAAVACGSPQYTLTVQKTGTGAGNITGAGIACGANCSAKFAKDTSVVLTAVADSGSTFTNWVGCDSSTAQTCTLKVTSDMTIKAEFTLGSSGDHTLTVIKSGTGSGTVTATGLDCGTTCSKSYPAGTSVVLTAAAAGGSSFASWTGCDSTSGTTCTVAMAQDRTVTAAFNLSNMTQISDNITTATTWTTGSNYEVTQPITVTAPLTIQPGVTVVFDTNALITATAAIHADGESETTPIIFTSASSSPMPGDWGGIHLAGAGSSFSHCSVLYAGAANLAAIAIDGVSASVTNCTIAHHATDTDNLSATAALDASDATAGTVVKNNLFYDDIVPLSVNVTFSPDQNVFDNSFAAPSSPQPSKYNGVVVRGCGHISSAIIWPALHVPYVIGNPFTACKYVNIDSGGTLTLGEQNETAAVKFFDGGTFAVNGVLNAHATFTSIKDDLLGDTNGDGTATTPAGGDWGGINVAKNGSTFDGSNFFYAGADNRSALNLNAYAATVTNSVFAHNRPATATVRAAPALDASEVLAASVLHDNTFFDNTVPLAMNITVSIDDSNNFTGDVGGTTLKNTFQAIVIRGCGHVASNITWAVTKVPLVIGDPDTACNYVNIDSAGHLTLADTVIVKFFGNGSMQADGILTANAGSGIVFTSFKDDAHGGDTNADAAATAAAPGDWGGINIRSNGSVFNKVSFLYGGGASEGSDKSVLYVASSKSVTLTNSNVAHTLPATDSVRAPAAVDISDGATTGMAITGNRFWNNLIPLAINANISLDDSNTFDSGVPSLPMENKYNAVFVAGCGHTTGNTSWLENEVPFVIGDPVTACNYMNVDGGGHLTFGPDVVLKFFETGRISVASGGTLTIGTGDYLTCMADDYLNDTNADGTATTPSVGDWYGIKYSHSGSDPTCDQSSYMHYQLANTAQDKCGW